MYHWMLACVMGCSHVRGCLELYSMDYRTLQQKQQKDTMCWVEFLAWSGSINLKWPMAIVEYECAIPLFACRDLGFLMHFVTVSRWVQDKFQSLKKIDLCP